MQMEEQKHGWKHKAHGAAPVLAANVQCEAGQTESVAALEQKFLVFLVFVFCCFVFWEGKFLTVLRWF